MKWQNDTFYSMIFIWIQMGYRYLICLLQALILSPMIFISRRNHSKNSVLCVDSVQICKIYKYLRLKIHTDTVNSPSSYTDNKG